MPKGLELPEKYSVAGDNHEPDAPSKKSEPVVLIERTPVPREYQSAIERSLRVGRAAGRAAKKR